MEQKQPKRFTLLPVPATETVERCVECLQDQQRAICHTVSRQYRPIHPKLELQLSKFIMRDPTFVGDLNKGILLVGSQGVGKTILMKAFCNLLSLVHFQVKQIDALDIQKAYRRGGDGIAAMEDMISDSPLVLLDDISEEVDIANNYGTKVYVGYEVLSYRHKGWFDKGFLTFATSNANLEMLGDKYGARISSRLEELFNVFNAEGEDLRRKPHTL